VLWNNKFWVCIGHLGKKNVDITVVKSVAVTVIPFKCKCVQS
jgi:hypothetical protein